MKKQLLSRISEVDSEILSTRRVTAPALANLDRQGQEMQTRSYREVSGVGTENSDWPFTLISDDSDLWQNVWALTSRCRDLFKTNSIYIKYRNSLISNIFGEKGIMLRMKIKETEDRVVQGKNERQEKFDLLAHEKKIQRLLDWAASKKGTKAQQYRAFHLAEGLSLSKTDDVLTGRAMIKVGQMDVFANMLIERRWDEWQRAQFCDLRRTRDYNCLRQLRLIGAVRDGDCFIRLIRSPKRNKFGFSIQVINAEWCDRFYNALLPSGNVVIMGIEYEMTDWGVGAPAAYYFIRRQPQDWQFTIPGAFNFVGGNLHVRIDASEIIHYARPVDADATRPAPWIASTIPKGRQLDQYELYEVIAAREAATKVGFLWSDMNMEGGGAQVPIQPKGSLPKWRVGPGDIIPLEWGVKYQERNAAHPSQNMPTFSKEMLRRIAAGCPGADYNVLANDLENINFSAGRLGRLDTNETSKMIQEFDINTAERPIFEAWLEMSLITGAIEMPLVKFEKFNKPIFHGRRWRGVDETKDVTAAALRVANKFNSRTREIAEDSGDFEEIAFELAEEEMLLDSLGLETTLTVEGAKQPQPAQDTADNETPPPAKNGNGKKPAKALQIDLENEREFQSSLALHRNGRILN